MQPAELRDHILAGPEVQVVRVAEHDLGAERTHLVRVEHLDGGLRPDRHERGRPQLAVLRLQDAGPRITVRRRDCEGHARGRSGAR